MVRPARSDDVDAILHLVHRLASYEREPDAVVATRDDFSQALFCPEPLVHCHVAEDARGEVVGMALWYVTFSTWLGRHGLWLEDLFVLPERRGEGHGRALLVALAGVCVERGYGRLEWWVLDWNSPAQSFYRSVGAEPMDEWTVWRLTGDPLASLADGASVASGSVAVARGHEPTGRTEG